MVRVTDEYSFEEICEEYIGGDLILELPSKIFSAIENWVERLSGGDIDFTNNYYNVFLPSFINGRFSKVKLNQLKDIDIDYELKEDDDSFDEGELRELFEDNGYDYLCIYEGYVYYLGNP